MKNTLNESLKAAEAFMAEMSGDSNTGKGNTGEYNTGRYNTGDSNTGDSNTGSYNRGYFNSGSYNTGNFNSGCFNTNEPKMRLFNRESEYTVTELRIKFGIPPHRLLNPETWAAMTDEDRAWYLNLPNFDAEIFEQITGIKIDQQQ